MSASLLLDGRCRPLRRRLGPVAWMILEEAALRADGADSLGSLWTPLSVRKVAEALGIGREAAARGLSSLVAVGLLQRSEPSRDAGGRFGPGGYWLVAPSGVAVSGVASSTGCGDPGLGGPCPVAPATVAAEVKVSGKRVTVRHVGGRVKTDTLPPGRASLFAAMVGQPEELDAATGTPPVVVESVGAVSSVGCEVVDRVHELAPGVRAGADPGVDPHPVKGGDAGC